MLTFNRKEGVLRNAGGVVIARGIWSGHGDAHNDPAREKEVGIGPLPAGKYKMSAPYAHPVLGAYVINLKQIEGDGFGRDLFRVHGDNKTPAQWDASHGCIIAPRPIRERMWAEPDHLLKVV